jgi:hypothetical protein
MVLTLVKGFNLPIAVFSLSFIFLWEMPKERKGPEESATLFAVGTRKRGNDGNMWIISETSAGVKRWIRASELKARKGPNTRRMHSGVKPKQPQGAPGFVPTHEPFLWICSSV